MAFLGTLTGVQAPTKSGGFLGSVVMPNAQQAAQAEKVNALTKNSEAAAENSAKQNSLGGFLSNFLKALPDASGIPQMAKSSFSEASNALTTAATGGSKTGGFKEGLDLVAGVGGVAFSPIAPIINPISHLITSAINTAGNALSNFKPIADYGKAVVNLSDQSQEDTATKILQTLQSAGNASMALLGAKGGETVKTKVTERLNGSPEVASEAIPSPQAGSKTLTEPKPSTPAPSLSGSPKESPVKSGGNGSQDLPSQRVETSGISGSSGKPSTGLVDVKTTKSASDISQRLVDQGIKTLPVEEQAKFQTGSYKTTADTVAKLLDDDPKLAIEAATGRVPVPSNITHPEILFNAVEAKAIAAGDHQTLLDLSKSPVSKTSEAGATLGSHGFNDNLNSPTAAIRDVQRVRASKLTPKTKEVVKQVRASIRKTHTPQSWGDFVKSIEC